MDFLERCIKLKSVGVGILLMLLIMVCYEYNHSIFFLINGNQLEIFNNTANYITQLGDGMTAVIICLLLWFKSPRRAFAGIIALIILTIIVQSVKSYFYLPRPVTVFGDEVNVIGEVLRHRSFPSGHSATIMAIARVLWGAFRSWVNLLLLLVILLVGLSRVYIGVHFPLDAAVGFMVGWLSAELALYIAGKIDRPTGFLWNRISWRIVLGLLFIGAIISCFFYTKPGAEGFYIFLGIVSGITAIFIFFRSNISKQLPPKG